MSPSRDPLWVEVLVALGAGNLSIGPIHCEDGSQYVQGYAVLAKGRQRGHVRLNPSLDLVDTAVHELTHRLRPRWSEAKVRAQTRKIMRELSDAEVDAVYAAIQAVATVRRRRAVVDVD
jgi:hypothetical protein